MTPAPEPEARGAPATQKGTAGMTIEAAIRGMLLLFLFGVVPAMGGCHAVFQWPWTFKPETGQTVAMFLAVAWPLGVQGAYAPDVRRGPRRADVLAHLGLCLCAALAAWAIWGHAEIMAACAAGTALGLLPFLAQALQLSWGLPLTSRAAQNLASGQRRLPATAANTARVTASAALAPLDGLPALLLLATAASLSGYEAAHPELEKNASIIMFFLAWLYLVLFVFRLGRDLRRSLAAVRILPVATGYGLLAAGTATLVTWRTGIWPLAACAAGALFGGWLAYVLNLDSRL